MRYFRRSIRRKLVLTLTLAVMGASLVSASINAMRDQQDRVEAKQAEVQGIAAAMAASVAFAVEAENRSEVLRSLRAISRIPGIKHARVVDEHGVELAQLGTDVSIVTSQTTTQWSLDPAVAFAGDRITASIPIVRGARTIGQLTIVADVSGLLRQLSQALLSTLSAALITAAIAIATAGHLISSFTHPVVALKHAIDRIRKTQKYDPLESQHSHDELGELVDAYNEMLAQIRDRDATLSRQRDMLEQEVQIRTRDLIEARQSAEAANAAKSDFLATMSHEIRTPMHGMMAMTELLGRSVRDDAGRRQLGIIRSSGHTLLAIIDDILDLSKIEAGKLELESRAFDPLEAAQAIVTLFMDKAKSKSIGLACETDGAIPEAVRGDALRLRQVLANLVSNAIKFTETGAVSVRLAAAIDHPAGLARLTFTVSDTGIGISEDKLALIFEHFTQADQTMTRRFGGTGIGLAISRRLVTAMGGDIAVTSTPGEGTRFTVTLTCPLADRRDLVAAAPATHSDDNVRYPGTRVLVADDNAINLEVMDAYLGRHDISVTTAADGPAAVALLEREIFDLVFMDCSMPGMDGLEATRRMRAHEQRLSMDRVPVIALTAHVVGTAMIGWQDAGIDEVITKPFQLSQISQALARHLRHKQRAKTRPSPAALHHNAELAKNAATTLPVLDPETFGGLRQLEAKGASGLLTRVIGLYADRAPAALAAIRVALKGETSAGIAEAAHALKSMSANLGAARVREACAELENAARADQLSKALDQTAAIESALTEALAELDALPERRPSGSAHATAAMEFAKRPLLRVLK